MNKKTLFSAVALLALSSPLAAAHAAGWSNAQAFPACFRPETMDRDGDHTGALGAPKCNAAEAQSQFSASDAYGEYARSRAR